MAIKRFQRGGSVYQCNVCGRRTRNTGDEGSVNLCFECYELAGIENEVSDNGPLEAPGSFTKPAYVVQLLRDLRDKGVDLTAAWGDSSLARYIPEVEQL
jgi:hypothetical protein